MAFAEGMTPVLTKVRQTEFVIDLMKNVQKEVLQKIASGDVPDDWDGIELRQWLADKFAQASGYINEPYHKKRWKAYRNALIVRNL